MGYCYKHTLSLCHTAGYKEKLPFSIAYMREKENTNIKATCIPLERSRVVVQMALVISPVQEKAPLQIYGTRQEFITCLEEPINGPV